MTEKEKENRINSFALSFLGRQQIIPNLYADYNKYKRLLLNVDSEDSECFNIKCEYVHELQHAFRMCGITKEIDL